MSSSFFCIKTYQEATDTSIHLTLQLYYTFQVPYWFVTRQLRNPTRKNTKTPEALEGNNPKDIPEAPDVLYEGYIPSTSTTFLLPVQASHRCSCILRRAIHRLYTKQGRDVCCSRSWRLAMADRSCWCTCTLLSSDNSRATVQCSTRLWILLRMQVWNRPWLLPWRRRTYRTFLQTEGFRQVRTMPKS